jgi:hypothetical protein
MSKQNETAAQQVFVLYVALAVEDRIEFEGMLHGWKIAREEDSAIGSQKPLSVPAETRIRHR